MVRDIYLAKSIMKENINLGAIVFTLAIAIVVGSKSGACSGFVVFAIIMAVLLKLTILR